MVGNVADTEPAAAAIGAGYEAYMVSLFATAARHFDGGHVDQARSAIRKGLAIAAQTRSEMLAISKEISNAG